MRDLPAGRAREHEALSGVCESWLATHDHGLLAVTGAAGSGKSALLGNLLAHTRPQLRSVLTRHGLITELTPQQRPPDNTFTVVLHLTGLSTQDALAHVAAELALDDPDSAATLTERLGRLLAQVARQGLATGRPVTADDRLRLPAPTYPGSRATGRFGEGRNVFSEVDVVRAPLAGSIPEGVFTRLGGERPETVH